MKITYSLIVPVGAASVSWLPLVLQLVNALTIAALVEPTPQTYDGWSVAALGPVRLPVVDPSGSE